MSAWLKTATAEKRFGLKGPRAAEVLAKLGFNVPARANTWAPLRAQDRDDSPNVIARLGNTEFFVEDEGVTPGAAMLEALEPTPGAYPVLREDVALVVGGDGAAAALAEVCNVNFAAPDLTPDHARKPIVMTLLTGVGVLVLPQATDAGTIYRIWCDPSFGPYLWETLEDVMTTRTGRTA